MLGLCLSRGANCKVYEFSKLRLYFYRHTIMSYCTFLPFVMTCCVFIFFFYISFLGVSVIWEKIFKYCENVVQVSYFFNIHGVFLKQQLSNFKSRQSLPQ